MLSLNNTIQRCITTFQQNSFSPTLEAQEESGEIRYKDIDVSKVAEVFSSFVEREQAEKFFSGAIESVDLFLAPRVLAGFPCSKVSLQCCKKLGTEKTNSSVGFFEI